VTDKREVLLSCSKSLWPHTQRKKSSNRLKRGIMMAMAKH